MSVRGGRAAVAAGAAALALLAGPGAGAWAADGGGPRARFLSATGREAGIDREGRCSSRDGVSVWDAG
ncbi:hypothetical protein, partial [Streptomyces acidiscabies]|uniref:hypothetical protein n=1 Tax=Streptomyces acidiscabies TaxID=42234 RepID=UPI000A6FF99E